MTPEEFRRHGHEVVDWIANYFEKVGEYPVLSQVEPGDVRARLPAEPPQVGEPFQKILEDLDRVIIPGITHWQSPSFFAYFPANASGASILGDLVSSGLGVQGMLWATSPACTELETHVLDWLVGALQLPETFLSSQTGGGVIQDTASSASLCALLAARERSTGFVTRNTGVDRRITCYASTEAHSSIDKAMVISGLGTDNLRKIETDGNWGMLADKLEAVIVADKTAGLHPCFATASVGTTSSGAIDPIEAIGEVCRRHGIWLHVDAAMYGTAALCPEFRDMFAGMEFADSYCFNPHKWMFVNFDCDCFYVADRSSLIKALSVLPEYLRNRATESGAVIDYRDWQIPLGRRFRALKLWFVMRHFGISGLQQRIREHVALAREFASWVDEHPDFELAAPAPLNLVCFRHLRGDEFNEQLLERLNRSGRLFLTHTKLNEAFVLRMCIGQTNTHRKHVEQAWDLVRETAAQLS